MAELELSFLDKVFQSPFPLYLVNPSLILLFQDAVSSRATKDGWDEEQLAGYMTRIDNYYGFLKELSVVLNSEIDSLTGQLDI